MKKFEIPAFYKSTIISKIKEIRKKNDPRKKDFSPSKLKVGNVEFVIARHFGFCYGVENAIEISYKAINANPDKRIFLLSQMIHNPGVNQDLLSNGVRFIQDTHGTQLIPWEEIKSEDIVIIPAFGTTIEIQEKLEQIGVQVDAYNTTCPFVEKVWNRSEKLGVDSHTIIIHGKHDHEETRATFSHSASNAPTLVLKNISEAKWLSDFILGNRRLADFSKTFEGRFTKGFDPSIHLSKIGVVNQTTMLASETQEITDLLRDTMVKKYGANSIQDHIADTRDTLCYATNDNQTATYSLLEESADFAIVVGGYNSSNTTHLVELLESKFDVYFINSEKEINDQGIVSYFNIHTSEIEHKNLFLNTPNSTLKIVITSGASCPDAVVDAVIRKILAITDENGDIEKAIELIQ
ncbi:MAG: 4-hydroxy-3-methylbut-2-enyl diphosphate reductase [Crocinitomicaceae bacterium]|nr:4-hydroxy-3-methylbut-2-enyl diphosphate reductase [Crocinitomicaceae bacterium]